METLKGKTFKSLLTMTALLLMFWTIMISAGNADAYIPQFKLENPGVGHPTRELGFSVSIDGDTLVAGAPKTDHHGMRSAGVARVWQSDGKGAWKLEAELVASDASMDDQFGCSVAISSNTLVVGAFGDDVKGESSGSAYVFTRSGGLWTQQAKLSAPDAEANDKFGSCVSLFEDTAVIGAWGDDTPSGADTGSAYVFTRSSGIWTQQTRLNASDAEANDQFGVSVSISGDTALVGALYDDDMGSNSGSVYVFNRSAGVWNQADKLTATDGADYDFFGTSLAVSGDTAVIGADWDDDKGSASGSAYIFVRSNDTWTQQQKLTAGDGSANSHFGNSVSISGDNAQIGALGDDEGGSGSGAAYVFTRTGEKWNQKTKLTAFDAAAHDRFGCSVSISGETAVVGANLDDHGGGISGSVYVFTSQEDSWTRQAKLTAGDIAEYDRFGISVAVSGKTALVGASWDDREENNSGSAFVFTRSGDFWVQQARLSSPDCAEGALFGCSVSISGETAVMGAFADKNGVHYSGSTYVFSRSDGIWMQKARLSPPDPADDDQFGASVSVSGDTVVVGAPHDNTTSGTGIGSVYVFTRMGDTWTQQAKLNSADAAEEDYFGSSVSISGDTMVVGAWGDDTTSGVNTGSAYVFTRSGNVWKQQAKLVSYDARANDMFGCSVAVSRITAVVGAYQASQQGDSYGAAYVFRRSGDAWTQQAKLVAPEPSAGDKFGASVAISDRTIVIGAIQEHNGNAKSGSAYVFTSTGGTWTKQAKITADDAAEGDHFGNSVSIDGEQAIVGAPWADHPENSSGAAYVFDLNSIQPPDLDFWLLY